MPSSAGTVQTSMFLGTLREGHSHSTGSTSVPPFHFCLPTTTTTQRWCSWLVSETESVFLIGRAQPFKPYERERCLQAFLLFLDCERIPILRTSRRRARRALVSMCSNDSSRLPRDGDEDMRPALGAGGRCRTNGTSAPRDAPGTCFPCPEERCGVPTVCLCALSCPCRTPTGSQSSCAEGGRHAGTTHVTLGEADNARQCSSSCALRLDTLRNRCQTATQRHL